MNYCSEISKKLTEFAKKNEEFLFIINFDCNQVYIASPMQAAADSVYFDFEGKTNFFSSDKTHNSKEFSFTPIKYSEYLKGFKLCKVALQRGDTYLINLTFKTPINTDYSLQEIFVASRAPFKLLFKNKFVVSSPERFVKIFDKRIETRPMKGTIDASIEDAEKLILENKKELFEHNTIVDLLRNDLNIIGKDVIVEKFRYLERIGTNRGELVQVSSVISGTIEDDIRSNLGEIICKLLPAGSISGAPKQKTIEIIKEVENYDRGFYTGIFGYFDGKTLDTAVNIRFIENENDNMFYKSGGGITALSNPEEEYEELLKKIYVPIF